MSNRSSVEDRLRAGYEVTESGCWEWRRHIHKRSGYGQIGVDKKVRYVHRVAWEIHRGPIPDGLDLDHLCRVRHCCNPDHLEPVTRSENILRGLVPTMNVERERAKTHCPHGHAYAGPNLYVDKRGWRKCLTCHYSRHGRAAKNPSSKLPQLLVDIAEYEARTCRT